MGVIVQYEQIHHLLRSRQQLPKSSDIVDPTPTRQFNCALLGLDPRGDPPRRLNAAPRPYFSLSGRRKIPLRAL